MNYVLLKNVKWSYVHGGIFRTKSNIHDETFFTSVKPYFKNVLKSIELPLGSIFYKHTLSWKNLHLWKLREKKSFC